MSIAKFLSQPAKLRRRGLKVVTSRLRVDSTIEIAHLRAVLKRVSRPARWCKLIAALVICAPMACSEQILPQLIAQIASLDHDHGISLHATNNGVDLILAHRTHATPAGDEEESLDVSQTAHVIHMISGPATGIQPASLIVSNTKQLVAYFPTTLIAEWRIFVPRLPLAYSRPPPEATYILPFHRSTLLLI